MVCEHCGSIMCVDFRSGNQALWRCKSCPHIEITEGSEDTPDWNSIEAYKKK